jgi:hypothetical protein
VTELPTGTVMVRTGPSSEEPRLLLEREEELATLDGALAGDRQDVATSPRYGSAPPLRRCAALEGLSHPRHRLAGHVHSPFIRQ